MIHSRRFRLWEFQVVRNSDRYLSTAPFPLAKVLIESGEINIHVLGPFSVRLLRGVH